MISCGQVYLWSRQLVDFRSCRHESVPRIQTMTMMTTTNGHHDTDEDDPNQDDDGASNLDDDILPSSQLTEDCWDEDEYNRQVLVLVDGLRHAVKQRQERALAIQHLPKHLQACTSFYKFPPLYSLQSLFQERYI